MVGKPGQIERRRAWKSERTVSHQSRAITIDIPARYGKQKPGAWIGNRRFSSPARAKYL